MVSSCFAVPVIAVLPETYPSTLELRRPALHGARHVAQGNRISNLVACNVRHPERSEGSAFAFSYFAMKDGEATRTDLRHRAGNGPKATADPSSPRCSG
jgi:hypothetical protein